MGDGNPQPARGLAAQRVVPGLGDDTDDLKGYGFSVIGIGDPKGSANGAGSAEIKLGRGLVDDRRFGPGSRILSSKFAARNQRDGESVEIVVTDAVCSADGIFGGFGNKAVNLDGVGSFVEVQAILRIGDRADTGERGEAAGDFFGILDALRDGGVAGGDLIRTELEEILAIEGEIQIAEIPHAADKEKADEQNQNAECDLAGDEEFAPVPKSAQLRVAGG